MHALCVRCEKVARLSGGVLGRTGAAPWSDPAHTIVETATGRPISSRASRTGKLGPPSSTMWRRSGASAPRRTVSLGRVIL